MLSLGVIYAVVALLGWGVGDFLIQKSTREVGSIKTLFVTGVIAFFGILPFIYHRVGDYSLQQYGYLILLSLIVLTGAIILFEAFRTGKLTVVESVVAVELPFTVLIALTLGGEVFSTWQMVLFVVVCVGIFLAATRRLRASHFRGSLIEKGTILAFVAAFFSAVSNFFTGYFAATIDPLLTIWVSHSLLGFWCGLYLWYRGEFTSLMQGIKKYPVHIFGQAALDNVAWVSFAFAASLLPIAIATTISESYIILAALLGFLLNGEKLHRHQQVGAVVALVSVIVLSTTL